MKGTAKKELDDTNQSAYNETSKPPLKRKFEMTAKTQKAPAYTPEMVETMKAEYLAASTAETVKALAEKFGKSVPQIRAKLVNLGVYKAKVYTTKQGEKPQKKDETADAIGRILGLSEGEADSLAKANKTALAKILKALCESKPIED